MSGFKRGELILSCKPYVHVLNKSCNGKRCDYCFKEKDNLKRCTQCSFVWFCNRLCQGNAWELHKLECKFIKKSYPKVPPDNLRMLSLLVLKIERDGDENPSVEVYGRKVTFKSLMSHAEEIEKDPSRCEKMKILRDDLLQYLSPSRVPLPPLLMKIFGKMLTNSFTIYDDEMSAIGKGLYLGASVFDHSCEPNAGVVFNGPNIIIRAVKDIPHRDINKVFISYIDQIQLTKDRQCVLQEKYYFTCKCFRCSSSTYDELMSKTLVPENDVKDKLKAFKEDMEQLRKRFNDEISLEVNPLSLSAASLTDTVALDQLAAQDKVLADSHILKGKTLETAFSACVNTDKWCEAVAMGKRLLKFHRLYYGPYHPIVGALLLNIGKIETFFNISSSLKTLSEADTVIGVTFGKDHPMYENVSKTLQQTLRKTNI